VLVVRWAVALAAALVLAVPAAAQDVEQGKALYGQYCAKCHSVRGRAPSLQGVGARSADLYLSTGYMPLLSSGDQPWRSPVRFSDRELRALVAYVASFGGPPIPRPHPERGDLAEGRTLFADNCAGCHQSVAVGGMLTDARIPTLAHATATQIAEAVRIGPYVMPRFSKQRLSDAQLDSVIRYVRYTQSPHDPGGWAIGHLGPIPEGMVAWLLAGSALVGVTLLIGRRRRRA
jgi:quinol---cytochrome-c reductase cytochrome c subunit